MPARPAALRRRGSSDRRRTQLTRSSQSPTPVSGRIGSQRNPVAGSSSRARCSFIACFRTRGRAWICSSDDQDVLAEPQRVLEEVGAIATAPDRVDACDHGVIGPDSEPRRLVA